MASFDLVIRGGELVDGTGREARRADVAIQDGLIVAIGELGIGGREEIDARGKIVTPGFVDIHTHYDGQATWESTMNPSSQHGVTTAVMGNCGVGFAPCRPEQRDMLVAVMEGVEDIPEPVMTAGLPWSWESFPEYLDVLDRRKFDIDLAAQLPHSALRVFVMGERAVAKEPATPMDLAEMRRLTSEAIQAGALGVSTSRSLFHRTVAGELAPSLHSDVEELRALAMGLRDAKAGVFQIIPDPLAAPEVEFPIMRDIAQTAGRPLSFSLAQTPARDDPWRRYLAMLEDANAAGLTMNGQVFPRPIGVLYGMDLTFHLFALHPSYKAIANRSLAERVAAMRDPGMRRRLLSEMPVHSNPNHLDLVRQFANAYPIGNPPQYEPVREHQISRQAAAREISVEEFAYDLLLEDEGRALFFLPAANYRDGNLDAAREMLAHPNTVLGLGDGGAHYGMICDASYPTFFLTRHVLRPRQGLGFSLPEAVRALTSSPARAVGLDDRGVIAPGMRADINVIDPGRLALHRPTVAYDLPMGGKRLFQSAAGYDATIVAGAVTYREGQATGILPGRLVRGARARN